MSTTTVGPTSSPPPRRAVASAVGTAQPRGPAAFPVRAERRHWPHPALADGGGRRLDHDGRLDVLGVDGTRRAIDAVPERKQRPALARRRVLRRRTWRRRNDRGVLPRSTRPGDGAHRHGPGSSVDGFRGRCAGTRPRRSWRHPGGGHPGEANQRSNTINRQGVAVDQALDNSDRRRRAGRPLGEPGRLPQPGRQRSGAHLPGDGEEPGRVGCVASHHDQFPPSVARSSRLRRAKATAAGSSWSSHARSVGGPGQPGRPDDQGAAADDRLDHQHHDGGRRRCGPRPGEQHLNHDHQGQGARPPSVHFTDTRVSKATPGPPPRHSPSR